MLICEVWSSIVCKLYSRPGTLDNRTSESTHQAVKSNPHLASLSLSLTQSSQKHISPSPFSKQPPPSTTHLIVHPHTIPPRLLILLELETVRRQPERLQDAVPQLLQLPHHLGHLPLLGGVDARGQGAQGGIDDLGVGGGKKGGGRGQRR